MIEQRQICAQCGGECCKYITIPLSELEELDIPWLQARGMLYGPVWRIKSRCPRLTDEGKCAIYETRPETCKMFEVGGQSCRRARAAAGIKVGGA